MHILHEYDTLQRTKEFEAGMQCYSDAVLGLVHDGRQKRTNSNNLLVYGPWPAEKDPERRREPFVCLLEEADMRLVVGYVTARGWRPRSLSFDSLILRDMKFF